MMKPLVIIVCLGGLAGVVRAEPVPSREVMAKQLVKLPLAKTKTRELLKAESCKVVSNTGDLVLSCGERGCAGGCQVIRREVTIRVRAGRWSVIATNAKHLGDTGECGCCM